MRGEQGRSRADEGGEAVPAVTRTSLYSYLVTRHTGRAVRLSIENRLAEYDRHVLIVLDFTNVPLIDFSCADEVVAKLVLGGLAETPVRRFFLFLGVGSHHMDPIESALCRQRLAVAAEGVSGEPLLLGAVDPSAALAWQEVWRLGRASPERVATELRLAAPEVVRRLEELARRRLLLRDGAAYLSFRRALLEAEASDETPAR